MKIAFSTFLFIVTIGLVPKSLSAHGGSHPPQVSVTQEPESEAPKNNDALTPGRWEGRAVERASATATDSDDNRKRAEREPDSSTIRHRQSD